MSRERSVARRSSRASAHAIPITVIVATVLLAFAPALSNGFVIWDDDLNFTDNVHYRARGAPQLRRMLTTLLGGPDQPLTWMTPGLDYTLWGMDARGYHLTSILLHALNSACCYFAVAALLRAAKAPAASDEWRVRLGALVAALLFAVHPLRVESVAWASERRDVVSGLFWLLTIIAYVRAVTTADSRWRWHAIAFGCFVASLLSKAWGITLPAVLLILDVYPLRRLARGTSLGALLLEKVPYAVLAAVAAAVAFGAQSFMPEMRSVAEHGVGARLAQSAYGLAFYCWKTLVPLRLSPAYLLESPLDPTARRYLASAAFVVAATIAAVAARRRAPWALAAWLAFGVIVSPVLGFAQTGPQLVADRYTYLATLPFVAVVGAGVQAAAARDRRVTATAAAAAIAVLGFLTFQQARVWHDSRTLWTHTLALDPTNHIAYTNRGWARQLDGDLDGAIDDYTRAIAVNPRYQLAYYNRGTAYDDRDELAAAAADYTAAITLDPADARPLNNRGWVRQRQGDLAGAIADYRHALAIASPDWVHGDLVRRNLATALAATITGRP